MPSEDPLKAYRQKRDFRCTSEPSGGEREASASKKPIFVIQKHAARSLHYDFRLEVDGALKSWAVPKGPSTDPGRRRLAIPVEDHPLEYADFEGIIPEGKYGAGTVLVWDAGTYRNLKAETEKISMGQSIERGMVEVWLEGKKLRGGYALIRTGRGEDRRWLLIKMNDEEADVRRDPTGAEPESVLTGRTLEEIAEQERDQRRD
jgi:DNA ligase D-like protein (predicted 3'-phosphoesterase)